MVNSNVLRTERVINLEAIRIDSDDDAISFFKGDDIADFKIDDNNDITILNIHGKAYHYHNHKYTLIYRNQEKL